MFNETPCYIGFPNQIWCEGKFAFDSFERTFKNKAPFFTSTFQYKDKSTPIIDNLFFDIDSYFSIRFPYRNIKRLRDYLHKLNVPTIIDFSGGKGFHLFAVFKPVVGSSEAIKDKMGNLMYSLQMHIADECGIEDYDEPTFGRVRFLVRYPTSLYWRRDDETSKMETSGFYCRYLTDEEFDMGLKRIVKLVKEPGEMPKKPKATMTMQELADSLKGFKLKERQESKKEIKINRAGEVIPSLSALGLPCLQDLCKHSHPTHFERIELVSWLKHLGYTDLSINAFIRNCNWTRYKYNITSYQIRTIRPRMVRCTFLRKSYGQLCDKCTLRRCVPVFNGGDK